MNTNEIKAVIFDWAGTIVDYGCIAPAGVFVEVFERRKISVSLEDARGPMGLAKRDHVAELLKLETVKDQWADRFLREPSEEDLNELYQELEPAMASIAANYSVPIPGAVELVTALRRMGIKVGSTTGYVESIMKRVLPAAKDHGLIPDAVVNSSDVPAGRPAPYMCFLNAIRMQVYPFHKMIKIGDTMADIKEGLNAGMWTIGITKSGNEVGLSQNEVKAADENQLEKKLVAAEKKLLDAGAHFVAEGVWECLPVIEHIEELCGKGHLPQNYRASSVNEWTELN